MSSRLLRLVALATALSFTAAPSAAQSGPGDTPGKPDTPTQVPLEGGLGLLALAGAAYAARRLRPTP